MATLFQRLLAALYVAIIAAPALNMVTRWWRESPLEGVSEPVSKPTLTASSFVHERYQNAYIAWFERSYGLRGAAVRLDSSIDYYVFGEAPAESRVRVGTDGILFIDEDINHFDRTTIASSNEIEAAARLLGRAQTKLSKRGKALLVIIAPSKTSLYPSNVPAAWRRDVPRPRPSDVLYATFVRELRRANVRFADARAVLQAEQGLGGEAGAFPLLGRHWNELEACIALREAVEQGRTLTSAVRLHELDCGGGRLARPARTDEEVDLWRLLNVWGAPPAVVVPKLPAVPRASADDAELPTALFVGSSFSWKLLFESERSRLFRSIHFYYYNKTVIDRSGTPSSYPVDPNSARWRAVTLSRDVYIVELPEWYLPGASADFLAQIDLAFPDDGP